MLYSSVADVDFALDDLPRLPRPHRVLMTTPEHYDIRYVINPHMKDSLGTVDAARARREWRAVRDAYRSVGVEVDEMTGAEGLVDMVFCANQTLPFLDPRTGRRGVVLSRMHAEQRRPEVEHFERHFREQGLEVLRLPEALASHFEGMGDALWHPGRYLLWGGHGFRTDPQAYRWIGRALDVRVVLLGLDDPAFYHLDTCLSLLDERSALVFPDAFEPASLHLVHHFFERVIEAPEREARELFACNAHCPDGRHVLIQRGCTVTNERLRAAGFEPVEVDTDEYLKAGGSVFCMKLMTWSD